MRITTTSTSNSTKVLVHTQHSSSFSLKDTQILVIWSVNRVCSATVTLSTGSAGSRWISENLLRYQTSRLSLPVQRAQVAGYIFYLGYIKGRPAPSSFPFSYCFVFVKCHYKHVYLWKSDHGVCLLPSKTSSKIGIVPDPHVNNQN